MHLLRGLLLILHVVEVLLDGGRTVVVVEASVLLDDDEHRHIGRLKHIQRLVDDAVGLRNAAGMGYVVEITSEDDIGGIGFIGNDAVS